MAVGRAAELTTELIEASGPYVLGKKPPTLDECGDWSRWLARDGPGAARHQAPLGDGEQGCGAAKNRAARPERRPISCTSPTIGSPKCSLQRISGGSCDHAVPEVTCDQSCVQRPYGRGATVS